MDKKKTKEEKIGHHAKPKRASATAALRTGADMCRTGVDTGSSSGADKGPDRRQSNQPSVFKHTTQPMTVTWSAWLTCSHVDRHSLQAWACQD